MRTLSPLALRQVARSAGEDALPAADVRPPTAASPQPCRRGRANFVRGAWRNVLRVKLALVDRRRYDSVVIEHVEGLPLVVLPDVFNPKLLRSGEFLVQQLARPDLLPRGSSVLDLGSGSGAAGVAAAKRGCAVTAVDINPAAVRCTRINALLNDVEIDARQGDLFSPLMATERFDIVLFNPPYYRGVPRDGLDHAWRSTDVPERFAASLASHLVPCGHALVVLSSDGDYQGFLDSVQRSGLSTEIVATRDFTNEVMRVYQVRPC
jgi:release factor glutamine methyltransferase